MKPCMYLDRTELTYHTVNLVIFKGVVQINRKKFGGKRLTYNISKILEIEFDLS